MRSACFNLMTQSLVANFTAYILPPKTYTLDDDLHVAEAREADHVAVDPFVSRYELRQD